jgi:hypothetical protein
MVIRMADGKVQTLDYHAICTCPPTPRRV